MAESEEVGVARRALGQQPPTVYVETDLDEACALGLQAAHLATTFRSARVLHYIRDIRHRLHELHGDHSQVQQFSEQISELLGAN
ncbi:MAG: hypothetical protein ACRDRH_05075 [Pseudonocardia sp.]